MKKLTIIICIFVLSGCATAKVVGRVGESMKANKSTVYTYEKEMSNMYQEWLDLLTGVANAIIWNVF